jgi:hypothetical protein
MLTFFATAKPFLGDSGIIQRNTLQSWKHLAPDVEVILFGEGRVDESGQPREDYRTATGHLENYFTIGPAILWSAFLLAAHAVVLVARVFGARVAAAGFSSPYRLAMPRLFQCFAIDKEEYWTKSPENQWVRSSRDAAFRVVPRYDRNDPHGCIYALGCFVLRRSLA